MPRNTANPVPITPPRVSLIDPRTGLIERSWYMFFLSLFTNVQTIEDSGKGPSTDSLLASYDAALQTLTQNVDTQPILSDTSVEIEKQIQAIESQNCCAATSAGLTEIQKQIQSLQVRSNSDITDLNEIQKQIQALQVQPQFNELTPTKTATAPVTKTADFTLADNETWVINNKSGSTCVVTLPTASLWSGREITIQNYQAQLLNSASSDVVPQAGASAGIAILLAVAGNWATMVSDGTNWIIMQAAANNNLLLE